MEKLIISIGRQFGSGGRVIGKALAQKLGIEYYDKELLLLAAKESGIASEFFEQKDEKSHTFFEQAIDFISTGHFFNDSILSGDRLFKIQSDAILKLAQEKSCVIVGRCSDYILRDNPNCVSIFLHSSDSDRAQRISKRLNISEEEAIEKMRNEDKKRANYYNFYSNKTWGESKTYDLSIDVSKIGEDQTIEIILQYLRIRNLIE
ncbi:MAG: cytidylate kinase-like family protein [Bacteroidales bacterium]|nr:cytidylate kinase-like family protein [Bacteroidales bacterium]